MSHIMSFHPYWSVFTMFKEEKDQSQPVPAYTVNTWTYKCTWGDTCHNEECMYLHRGQQGYFTAPYYQSKVPCKYETEESACRLKCGQSSGKYCPFQHCTHESMVHITIQCPRKDCQRHCPQCI